MSRRAPLLALEHGADDRRVERGVAAPQVRHASPGRSPSAPGSTRQSVTSNAPVPSPRTSRTLEGEVTLSSSSPSSAWTISERRLPVAPKTPAMIGADRRVAHADELVPDPGRVGERPEEVEHGRHPELLADRPDEAHGGVEALGEAEPHARLGDAAGHALGADLDRHAQRLEHVGRARPTTTRRGCRACRPGTPQPAVMNAASVVTLMLARRSPPVPTRSTTAGARGGLVRAGRARRRRPWPGPGRSPPRPSPPWRAAGPGTPPPGPAWPRPARTTVERLLGLAASSDSRRAQAGQDLGPGQSHHRSRSSTPRAMRPSCTWDVPSTMVSCLASRYHCSVGWSSM